MKSIHERTYKFKIQEGTLGKCGFIVAIKDSGEERRDLLDEPIKFWLDPFEGDIFWEVIPNLLRKEGLEEGFFRIGEDIKTVVFWIGKDSGLYFSCTEDQVSFLMVLLKRKRVL